jgi:hypothetical protein
MAAMTYGPVPVLAVEVSSPTVTSRTQCTQFSIFQWPRIQAPSWPGRECRPARAEDDA